MSEPVELLDREQTDSEAFDAELTTNRLNSGRLDADTPTDAFDRLTVDWLARLQKAPADPTADDEAPQPEPVPSGMSQHIAPPVMVHTLGARLTTGLRRLVVVSLVALITLGTAGAGAYALLNASWFAPAVSTPAAGSQAAQHPQQEQKQEATKPEAAQPQTNTEAGVQPPKTEGALPDQSQVLIAPPSMEEGTVLGSDAGELLKVGVARYRDGDFAGAIEAFERSLTISPGDALAYYQLGLAHLAITGRERSLDDAELAFRTATSLQPDRAAPYAGLAESLLRRGFFNEAIPPALEATRLDPTMAEAWITLAKAYEGAGKSEEATRAYAEATRHSPAPPAQP